MKNGYPFEKFSNAVSAMAVSPNSIQERVADAYIFNLMYLKAEDLPEEIRLDFKIVCERLTSVEPVADEGSVYASVKNMDTDEAIEIARKIVYMADMVESAYRNY